MPTSLLYLLVSYYTSKLTSKLSKILGDRYQNEQNDHFGITSFLAKKGDHFDADSEGPMIRPNPKMSKRCTKSRFWRFLRGRPDFRFEPKSLRQNRSLYKTFLALRISKKAPTFWSTFWPLFFTLFDPFLSHFLTHF